MSKLEVLELAAARGEVDSEDVADALGLSAPAAAMALLRLHRQGKLRRQRVVTEGRTWVFTYQISDAGAEYLEWTTSR